MTDVEPQLLRSPLVLSADVRKRNFVLRNSIRGAAQLPYIDDE